MKKHLLLFLTLLLFAHVGRSQTYSFSKKTDSYSEFSGGTEISNGVWGFGDIFTVPLPFSFKAFDKTYSKLYLTGGFVGFEYEQLELDGELYDQFLGPQIYVNDSDLNGIEDESPITYTTTGSSGARIFKIQWKNARYENDENLQDYTDFQLWLYENSNLVEIHYGPTMVTSAESYEYMAGGTSVSILKDYSDGIILTGDPSNPTVNTPPVTNIFLTGSPSNGQVYVFTPSSTASTLSPVANARINVSPNPFTDRITINNQANTSINQINIYGNDGRLVYSSSENIQEVNTSDLNSGIYVLEIVTNIGTARRKLIK